jgi:hypothetical protein
MSIFQAEERFIFSHGARYPSMSCVGAKNNKIDIKDDVRQKLQHDNTIYINISR